MSRIVTVHVDGEEKHLNLDDILIIRDQQAERETVAADIAYWGAMFGGATSQLKLAEAASTKWMGQQLSESLRSDEKVAEWKARSFAHGSPEYVAMKEAEGNAEGNCLALQAVYEAYKQKGRILERLIGVEQALISSSTRIGRTEIAAGPSASRAETDPRVAKMRGLIKAPGKK